MFFEISIIMLLLFELKLLLYEDFENYDFILKHIMSLNLISLFFHFKIFQLT